MSIGSYPQTSCSNAYWNSWGVPYFQWTSIVEWWMFTQIVSILRVHKKLLKIFKRCIVLQIYKFHLDSAIAQIKDKPTNIVAGYIWSGKYALTKYRIMKNTAVIIHTNFKLLLSEYSFSLVNSKHNNPVIKMSPSPIEIPSPNGIWIKIGIWRNNILFPKATMSLVTNTRLISIIINNIKNSFKMSQDIILLISKIKEIASKAAIKL